MIVHLVGFGKAIFDKCWNSKVRIQADLLLGIAQLYSHKVDTFRREMVLPLDSVRLEKVPEHRLID